MKKIMKAIIMFSALGIVSSFMLAFAMLCRYEFQPNADKIFIFAIIMFFAFLGIGTMAERKHYKIEVEEIQKQGGITK